MSAVGLKLLFVHEAFAPDFRGGGEYVLLEAARAMQDRGHSVRVLCAGDPQQTTYAGIPTRRLPRPRHLMNLAVCTVARMARDVDVVLTFTYNAAWAGVLGAKLARRPCILEVLGLFGEEWMAMRGAVGGRIRYATERALMRAPVDRFIFLSDFSRDLGISLGASRDRSRILSPGVDDRHFVSDEPKQDHVLFVGRVESRKGIDDLLTAARRLTHVPFRIVGWGDEIPAWRAKAPANVVFVDYQRGAPAIAEFAQARIFAMPSRAETFGIAAVEAMAAGCAVVSSLLLPFEGARIPAGDAAALTTAIDRLWRSPEACRAAGALNRESARPFSWRSHAERLEEICLELVAPSPQS